MSEGPRREPNPRARLATSVGLSLTFLVLYLVRPDWAQAIHWWPMAFATPLVLLPFLSLRPRRLLRPFLATIVVWAACLQIVGEPTVGIVMSPGPKRSFRIVTLNCAGGTLDAAREAFAQDADLVLLEEVGTREEFERAGAQAGYPFVSWSVDDAVFSRRPLEDPDKGIDFAAATVDLNGTKTRVVALRLLPPTFRLDLWNPGCWRAYAEDLAERRNRARTLLPEGACLVGGDFNATNPRIVTDARPELREAGREAARGWRGTGTNDFPCVWTDQLWASPEIRWTQSVVRKTQNSDHRMVVADFEVR